MTYSADLAPKTASRSPPPAAPLTPEEAHLLAEHELTLSQGLAAWIAVGLAIAEIRDLKLYRPYENLNDYLDRRWGISRAQGYRLMEAARAVTEMSRNARQMTHTQRGGLALAAVPVHLREKVEEMAIEEVGPTGTVTEPLINRLVLKLMDARSAAAREAAPPASGTADEEDEEEEDEEDEDDTEEDEGAEEEDAAAPTAASTLRRAAKHAEKRRLFVPRCIEHGRLCEKDMRKVDDGDLETEEACAALLAFMDRMGGLFSEKRLQIAKARKERESA